MELEIRQVKPGEVALFDRVADAVFDEPVDPGRLAAYLAEPGHHMLVALLAGEVVAQVASATCVRKSRLIRPGRAFC
jgi:hypothetical protein